eukprot:COSAG02_NODE_2849_length_7902_cov_2.924773_5_plen_72_part_00
MVASEKCGIYVGFGRLSDLVSVGPVIYRSCDGSVSKVVIWIYSIGRIAAVDGVERTHGAGRVLGARLGLAY